MNKRPVCVVVLLFMIGLMLSIYTGGWNDSPPKIPDGEQCKVEGIVRDKVWKQTIGGMQLTLYVETADEKILCVLKDISEEPLIGQRIIVSGKPTAFQGATNPGEFDAKEYYQISNISYKIKNASIIEASNSYSKTKESLYRMKRFLGRMLESVFDTENAAVMKTMMLSDKSTLDDDVKELYQLGGIVHILAISGLHISMLGMAVYNLLGVLYAPLWIRVPLSIGMLIAYGTMVGMGTSVVRAIGMYVLFLLAKLCGRTYDLVTALAIMAFGMLCENPMLVKNSGFLLSFGAVLSIAVIVPWWQDVLTTLLPKISKILSSIISGSGITIGTLPILLLYYNRFPIYAIIMNLFVIPLMPFLVLDGLAAVGLGMYSVKAARVSTIPGVAILKLYKWSCSTSLSLPGGNVNMGHTQIWKVCVYYAVVCFLILIHLYEKRRLGQTGRRNYIRALLQMATLSTVLIVLIVPERHGTEVTFLDVGQGDCIIIRGENGDCYMVDGGSTSKKEVGKYQMIPYLRYEGISSLKGVFITHPDSDHISGIMELLEQEVGGIPIETIILPDISEQMKEESLGEIVAAANQKGVEILYMSQGQQIQDQELRILSLGPTAGIHSSELNEISQVLLLTVGNVEFLLTGDVTGEPEKEAAYYYAGVKNDEAYTILKVAHHGSKYSTDEVVLDDFDPEIAIISSGFGNKYGHPHKELLKRLYGRDISVLRTDKYGAIIFAIRNEKIQIKAGAKKELLMNH